MKTFVIPRSEVTFAHLLTPFLHDITDEKQPNGNPAGRDQADAIFTANPAHKTDELTLASMLTFSLNAEPVRDGLNGSLTVRSRVGGRLYLVGADGSDHGSDQYYFGKEHAELMALGTFENYRWCSHVRVRAVYKASAYEQHVSIEYGVMYAVAIAHGMDGTYRPMVERTTDWPAQQPFKADAGETVVHIGFIIFCQNDRSRRDGLHWMAGKQAFTQAWTGSEDADDMYEEAKERGEARMLTRLLGGDGESTVVSGSAAKSLLSALFGGRR